MRFRTLVGITLIAAGTSVPSREPAAAQSAQGHSEPNRLRVVLFRLLGPL